ncbi:MAG: helix-turn-helix domain-containing protein [Candidatus Tantalella remota]|nr:helix-turn-helix domain-containing protein [Candidatus Tantalella remota]
MEKLLTVKDLCEYLQISQALVYKWVHYSYIPYIEIGGVVRFSRDKVERWGEAKASRGAYKTDINIDNLSKWVNIS